MSYDGYITESQVRLALLDFLRGLVEFDPAKRWSPLQVFVMPPHYGDQFWFMRNFLLTLFDETSHESLI